MGVIIEVSAAAVCCRRARFLAGLQLRACQAEIAMDDAELAAASIISGGHNFQSLDDDRWSRAINRLRMPAGIDPSYRHRLVSLRREDVARLTVARTDLSACRFTDAHHLDQLRLDAGSDFTYTPASRRWTRRRTIAEEHDWRHGRASRRAASGWYGPAQRPSAWLDVSPPASHPLARGDR